jgi:hypothetical protein
MAMGGCYANEQNRVIVGADGSVRREASLESARKAYERALSLGPKGGAVRALQVLTNNLDVGTGDYVAARVFDGDTLSAVFERRRPFDPPSRRKALEAPRRAKLLALATFWRRYTAMHPEDLVAHATLGVTYAQLGQPDSASVALTRATELAALVGDRNRLLFNTWRVHVALQLGHPERAAALVDSIGIARAGEGHRIAFGRFVRAPGAGDNPWYALSPVTAGIVLPDSARNLQALVRDTVNGAALRVLYTTLAFHAARRRPAADTSASFSLYRFQAFLSLGDTARARRALDEFDAWGRERADDYWDGYEMFAAESRLELGDTTAAWDRIAPFASRSRGFGTNLGSPNILAASRGREAIEIIGRTWLVYADVAMATGHTAEARRGYQMIVGMWEKGDPPVQPLVKRARDALAKLGTQ